MDAYEQQNAIAQATIRVGSEVTIGPAYDAETKARTRIDEVTGRSGTVVWIDGGPPMIVAFATVDIGTEAVYLPVGRLALRGQIASGDSAHRGESVVNDPLAVEYAKAYLDGALPYVVACEGSAK